MRKRFVLFILLLIGTLGATLTAQKDKKPPRRIKLAMQWTAQAQFAGYTIAQRKGLYEDAGLDVDIHYHDSVHSSLQLLTEGKVQYAVMNLIDAVQAKIKGAPIVNVMQTSHMNSYCIVSQHPVHSLDDIKGEEVSLWHGFSPVLREYLSELCGHNVKWLEVFGGIETFRAGAVQNTLCTTYNELLQLEESGMKIDADHIIYLKDMGVNLPEDGLYVTESYYNSHREEVRTVTETSAQGWQLAFNQKKACTEIIIKEMANYNIRRNFYHEEHALIETERLQKANQKTIDYVLHPHELQLAIDILRKTGSAGEVTYTNFAPYLQ